MLDGDDGNYEEALAYLKSKGVDKNAIGIAKLYFDKGENALSGPQLHVFKKYALPYIDKACNVCGAAIPFGELIRTDFDGNLCYGHAKEMAKDEKELRRA